MGERRIEHCRSRDHPDAAIGTGSFFVEEVFNIPGMGKFFVTSMQTKDQTMILAVVLLYGVFLAVMNLLVDLLYGLINPRIRHGS